MTTETTPIESADEYGYESHPAWALIGAHRVTGGAALFDSDVKHQHYVTVTLSRAKRKRDLHRDWFHPGEEIVEVAMSEAQWAAFVSSMNSGTGVPATLTWDRTREDPRVPAVPFEPRLAESLAEVRSASADAMADVQAAFDAYKEHKTVGNLRTLEAKIENLPSNLEFAAKSLSGHAERPYFLCEKHASGIEEMFRVIEHQEHLAYWRLYRAARAVYTRRGALVWMRHHRRKGTPLDEQFRLIESLTTGAHA